MDKDRYSIRLVENSDDYASLRDLWCAVFGDEPEYVDHVYESFGCDIEGYIVTDEYGTIVSALTCYKCGTYADKDVYVSYAICTDPAYRGQGLARALTRYVRDLVLAEGGISILSPASQDLESFYEALGYEQHFFSQYCEASSADDEEDIIDPEFAPDTDVSFWGDGDGDFGSFDPDISAEPIDAAAYNTYREKFLADVPHIRLSSNMAEFIKGESAGGNGLFVINGGDAICMIQSAEQPGEFYATELLINPALTEFSSEIGAEIADKLAGHFGQEKMLYQTPGYGKCQSMLAASSDVKATLESSAYFGFPID